MLQLVFQKIGADGTQYAELSMIKKNPTSIKGVRMDQSSRSMAMKTTLYAEIDHIIQLQY